MAFGFKKEINYFTKETDCKPSDMFLDEQLSVA